MASLAALAGCTVGGAEPRACDAAIPRDAGSPLADPECAPLGERDRPPSGAQFVPVGLDVLEGGAIARLRVLSFPIWFGPDHGVECHRLYDFRVEIDTGIVADLGDHCVTEEHAEGLLARLGSSPADALVCRYLPERDAELRSSAAGILPRHDDPLIPDRRMVRLWRHGSGETIWDAYIRPDEHDYRCFRVSVPDSLRTDTGDALCRASPCIVACERPHFVLCHGFSTDQTVVRHVSPADGYCHEMVLDAR